VDSQPEVEDNGEMQLIDLPTPSLILDQGVLSANLEKMATRLKALGVGLRPHVKTHKCVEIARQQRRLGALGLTVSTLAEAKALAAAGFEDLTWAFPVILNRIDELDDVAGEATLRLVVDSVLAVNALAASGRSWHTWLKVDCGYHRVGVDPGSDHAVEVARRINNAPGLIFDGILTHAGHSYHGRGREDLVRVAKEERRVMADFAERLRGEGIEVPGVSVGSTPTMSVVEDLTGVTEARPGNYAFYDTMQYGLGACDVTDIAVTVLSSVVSSQPGASHSVIDAGALSLSRDGGLDWTRPQGFGRIALEDGRLDPETWVTGLSQENGILNCPLEVGTRVRIVPNHSCLVVPNFEHYHVVEHGRVVDRWDILRG
jgi:D-serine deaminase-like pyridoxal phosphate-dependent protein